jgi:hypothetical protein
MQVVPERPLPYRDPGRERGRGLSVQELDAEPRHIRVERVMSDAALVQVDLEGRAGDMVASRELDFLHCPVVANQQDQIAVRAGVSVHAFRWSWRQIGAHLHGVVEGVDADRLEIDLPRRHGRIGGAEMPLGRQVRDAEAVKQQDVAGRQRNQNQPDRQESPIAAERLKPIHPQHRCRPPMTRRSLPGRDRSASPTRADAPPRRYSAAAGAASSSGAMILPDTAAPASGLSLAKTNTDRLETIATMTNDSERSRA